MRWYPIIEWWNPDDEGFRYLQGETGAELTTSVESALSFKWRWQAALWVWWNISTVRNARGHALSGMLTIVSKNEVLKRELMR